LGTARSFTSYFHFVHLSVLRSFRLQHDYLSLERDDINRPIYLLSFEPPSRRLLLFRR
jgi:hypothetical protein